MTPAKVIISDGCPMCLMRRKQRWDGSSLQRVPNFWAQHVVEPGWVALECLMCKAVVAVPRQPVMVGP